MALPERPTRLPVRAEAIFCGNTSSSNNPSDSTVTGGVSWLEREESGGRESHQQNQGAFGNGCPLDPFPDPNSKGMAFQAYFIFDAMH